MQEDSREASQDAENVLIFDLSTGYTGAFILQKFIEYILDLFTFL